MAQTLDEFLKEVRADIVEFEKWWRKKNDENPEQFPMEMTTGNEGLWWEFLQGNSFRGILKMEIVKMEIDMPDIKNAQYEFDDPDREVMDKVRRAVQFDRAGDPIKDAYRKYYSQTGRKPMRIYVGRSELIDLRSSTCAYVTCRA